MKLTFNLADFFRNRKVSVSAIIVFAIIQISIVGIVALTISSLQSDRIEKSTDEVIDHHFQLVKNLINVVEGETGNGFTDRDHDMLKTALSIEVFSNTGTTSLVSSSGEVLIDDVIEGSSQSGSIEHTKRLKDRFGKFNYSDGTNYVEYFEYVPVYDAFLVVKFDSKALYADLQQNKLIIIALALIMLLFSMIFLYRLSLALLKPLSDFNFKMVEIAKGKIVDKSQYLYNNEFGEVSASLNKVIDGITNNANFAEELSNHNYTSEFSTLSEDDVLGNSLVKMRDSLIKAEEAEKKNKEIEQRRDWINTGIAKFSDILRDNLSQKELGYKIVSNLVEYIGANQGGMFIYDDSDKDNIVLNLESSYAYSRRKFLEKQIFIGEGLVGTCALEKETIYLTEIPENYANITSGLGDSAPRSIVIIPLLVEKDLFGIMELASLREFQDFEIEFMEKLAESIAVTMANAKRNDVTQQLLEQSKIQSEELAAQEEEMRQNMEELQATQEESYRKETEVNSILDSINKAVNVVKLDDRGDIVSINDNLIKALNSQEETFKGMHYSSVVKPANGSINNSDLWEELQKGILVTRDEIVIANNINAPVKSTYSPVMDVNNELENVLIIVQ